MLIIMSKHLKNVCMPYFKHMNFSLSLSKDLLGSSAKAFVHAFFPDIYTTSTTDTVNKLQEKMSAVGCNDEIISKKTS